MKKSGSLLLTLAFLSAAAWGSAAMARKAQHLKKTALYFPNGRKIMVAVADTPKEREIGLMFRKTLPKRYGMLFVFPQKDGMEFWMKNTWTSLDIVYIGVDKQITAIHSRVKASTPKTTDDQVARVWGVGQYVLELPAGTAKREHFKIGQKMRFKASIPIE
ncbi:MAG TPA: DUF192 domain-containing protein [Elusimicrobiota bacterium]|jgi:uncharacterized protein|nr:DUF192 domain-containing protein [Elusimicrobiota bacterium]